MIEQSRLDDVVIAARERADATLNSIGDAVLSIDMAGQVTYLNLAAEALTGWSRELAVGRRLSDIFQIIDGQTRATAPDPLQLALTLDKAVGLTPHCILIRRNGDEVAIEDSAAPIRSHAGHVTGAVIVFRDVGAARETSRQMSHLARHDVLTGLPNRVLLEDRLTAAIASGHRRSKAIAVLYIDIDGFKEVNDALGHAAGDHLLRLIAAQLHGALRQSDTVSRVGGDEFVVILSDIEQPDDASLVAQKLLRAVASLQGGAGLSRTLSASVGIALCPAQGADAETLLEHADAAMYEAKRSGAGQYRIFTSAMHTQAHERLVIERDLLAALERGEFVVHYQRQVCVSTGVMVGVEALLRWRHPRDGLLAAALFLPSAVRCHLIAPIGLWVLYETCRQARAWQAAGNRPLSVSVNISASEFWGRHFTEDVLSILRSTQLAPGTLSLELTEDTLMQDASSALTMLRILRDAGIQLAIDWFGTGHSGLGDLVQFPIGMLKIAPSFLHELAAGLTGPQGLVAIVGLGKSLNCRVMATGIETQQQCDLLRTYDCPEAQGHLFGTPTEAARVEHGPSSHGGHFGTVPLQGVNRDTSRHPE